jgi:hypothetical protein
MITTLDQIFAREIKKQANGDGSREAKFAFKKKVEEVARTLSTTKAAEIFDECIKKYGRVPVSICVAQTIIERRERLELRSQMWALEVMKLYTNAPRDKMYACINDGLHPTSIEEYAGSLLRLTIVED